MDAAELNAMIASDERHWWYRGRRRVLHSALETVDLPHPAEILDAGCGSGRMMEDLEAYGRVHGVDLSPSSVAAARARGFPDTVRARIERLPFEPERFDLVTCLDVIEHTPDDRRTLTELRRVTRPGGHLLLTVPAYPSLWSHHDDVNGHYRRYRVKSLLAASSAAGWRTERTTHFNSLLLAPAAGVRLLQRRRPAPHTGSDLNRTPPALDAVLELPLRLEAAVLRFGFSLPAGLSLLALLCNDTVVTAGRAAPRARAQLRRLQPA